MYGKIIDGTLIEAPKRLIISGNQVWNASEEDYRAQWWKPVRFTERPEAPDGYYYEIGWDDEETEIVQTWVLVKIPDVVNDAEAFNIIFGGEV